LLLLLSLTPLRAQPDQGLFLKPSDPQAAHWPAWLKEWASLPWPECSATGDQLKQLASYAAMRRDWHRGDAAPARISVIDARTRQPLDGVLLASWQSRQFAVTGSAGNVAVPLWYPREKSEVHVRATLPGYATSAGWAPRLGGEVRVALEPNPCRLLQGRVLGPDARPAKRALVAALPQPDESWALGGG